MAHATNVLVKEADKIQDLESESLTPFVEAAYDFILQARASLALIKRVTLSYDGHT